MLKKFFGIAVLVFVAFQSFAQIAPEDLELLQKKEQELAQLSNQIVNDSLQDDRAAACFKFIPRLVNALKVNGSFHYPFSELETISILTPADKSFRIFTWQLWWGDGSHRYFGAIQLNTPGKLTLFPLFDNSDSLFYPIQDVLDNDTWYGALYYNIYEFGNKKKKYYLLFGWDGNDYWSSIKLIDVLHFENDKPVFGAPVFQLTDEDGKKKFQNRFIIEFRKDAAVSLNYSSEEKLIIFDHLVAPEERLEDLRFTYLPDGTYEGFKLKKDKWVHVEKIKTINIGHHDKPPVPVPKK